jgi:hypothetical protein
MLTTLKDSSTIFHGLLAGAIQANLQLGQQTALYSGVPNATSAQYGQCSTLAQQSGQFLVPELSNKELQKQYVDTMKAAALRSAAGVYGSNITADNSNWQIPNSGSLFIASDSDSYYTTVGEAKTVDPMGSFYVEGTNELNWKAIHNVFQTENLESLPARIAMALIQAKECGFKESAKR